RVWLFFFSSRRRHTRSKRDWSSDVCSSDLLGVAQLLYDVLDDSKLFTCPAQKGSRSDMNVTFRTGNADLDAKFVAEATAAGFVRSEERRVGKGWRSRGGGGDGRERDDRAPG